jgi:hypothetical protein
MCSKAAATAGVLACRVSASERVRKANSAWPRSSMAEQSALQLGAMSGGPRSVSQGEVQWAGLHTLKRGPRELRGGDDERHVGGEADELIVGDGLRAVAVDGLVHRRDVLQCLTAHARNVSPFRLRAREGELLVG